MDFANDEKLRMCSAAATGVYIRLMCILHKSKEYGKLKVCNEFVYTKHDTNVIQTAIQNADEKEILYSKFAENLTKQMPYTNETIKLGLLELDYYGVIRLDGDTLYQPRMVKDAALSEKRSKSVNKRWSGEKEQGESESFVHTKVDTNINTKVDTNTEYENEYEYEYNIIEEERKGVQGKREPTTKSTQRRFTPPTLEEVMEYCKERNNGIDPIQFFDFYEANGWIQGKGKPIKDWKAAVRTWERNGVVTTNGSRNGQRTETKNATGRPNEVQGSTTETRSRRSTI